MPRAASVQVHGLREVNRAFKRIDDQLVREVKEELKKAAEPVAADARERIGHYAGASTSTIAPIATMRGAVVRQRQNKKTGNRPDFGGLQVVHMIHALEDNESQVVEQVEDLIDWLGRKEGF